MLFQWGRFKSAAGLDLDWKIECDTLTKADWLCIAAVGARRLPPFGKVIGVPNGGLALADALEHFRSPPYQKPLSKVLLVVDDVWTTGKSMREFVGKENPWEEWYGYVAFARGVTPHNVLSFARIYTE